MLRSKNNVQQIKCDKNVLERSGGESRFMSIKDERDEGIHTRKKDIISFQKNYNFLFKYN